MVNTEIYLLDENDNIIMSGQSLQWLIYSFLNAINSIGFTFKYEGLPGNEHRFKINGFNTGFKDQTLTGKDVAQLTLDGGTFTIVYVDNDTLPD